MSELNAAWGLALLKDYKKIISRKKSVYEEYKEKLNLNKIEIIKPRWKIIIIIIFQLYSHLKK